MCEVAEETHSSRIRRKLKSLGWHALLKDLNCFTLRSSSLWNEVFQRYQNSDELVIVKRKGRKDECERERKHAWLFLAVITPR